MISIRIFYWKYIKPMHIYQIDQSNKMSRKWARQNTKKGRFSPASIWKTTAEFKLQMREFLLEDKHSDWRAQIRRSLRFFDRHY